MVHIVDVNCGTYGTFAVAADGAIYACGLNNYGQLALPGLTPVVASGEPSAPRSAVKPAARR